MQTNSQQNCVSHVCELSPGIRSWQASWDTVCQIVQGSPNRYTNYELNSFGEYFRVSIIANRK